MEENLQEKKIYKKFSDYYKDPEFKRRHDEYVATKIQCQCGQYVARYNISKHKKTNKHIRKVESLENI